jgi:nucleoside-diphosphate-sugar epimerase
MSKTLVTGASGFTGQNLCERLVQEGEQVVAFVRPTSNTTKLKALGVECEELDITDPIQVRDHFTNIKTVYHVAGAYRTEHAEVEQFRLVNVEATRNLLEAAKGAGVERFVHCSTVGVQGEIEDPPASEEYRMQPGDHYQQTKADGEILARKYFVDGLPGAVVRPVGIYGPGDTRFLKLFRPINRGYFVMIGSGKTLYHMTYIDDLIEGFVLCGRHPHALGEVFTIAGEKYTTIKDLVNLIADVLKKPSPRWRIPFWPVYASAVVCEKTCRLFGVSPFLYPRRVEFFHLDRAFSIEKSKNILGYQPKVGLREGLERTAGYYRTANLL